MKTVVFLFLCMTASADATELPSISLFLTPDEAKLAEALAQKTAPAGAADIRLGAIMYYAPADWVVWLQNQRWTPDRQSDDLRILEVSAGYVRLSWQGDDGQPAREITLMPNQRYEIATGAIVGE